MALPWADGLLQQTEGRKGKLHEYVRPDSSMTSEVPTALLISFDDDTSTEGNKSNMGEPSSTDNNIELTLDSHSGPNRHDLSAESNVPLDSVADCSLHVAEINQNDSQKRGTIEHVKLCGYLNKMGDRGILKSYKTRWFVFDNQRCRLYYYRTPQDLLPLGSIDIANATFNFEVNDSATTGQFHICTGGRMYQLQAKDRQTMMFWLQELQERRRAYSQQRTSLTRDKSPGYVSPTSVGSGLISTKKIKERSGDPFKGVPPILGPVGVPRHTVGESTAHTMQQTGCSTFLSQT